jgi:hypothetical protein
VIATADALLGLYIGGGAAGLASGGAALAVRAGARLGALARLRLAKLVRDVGNGRIGQHGKLEAASAHGR